MTWKHFTYSLLLLLLASVALLQVWSAWQFQINAYQLRSLERRQELTLEQNRRLQANITALSAPERLLILIEQNPQWQLRRLAGEDITIIDIKE
ncbi:hypothetical protein [Entomospira culicis]|uniref:Cell division protein FtsL n=1 Tax=Entomospira culicis TaxID=2719989 RepID=A0A968GIF8_9SPIO|nr:hypothetical protein [Entomospira culicis]NIZ19448.1 hypothetical protein [Entomospira culicis]NIZ69647.1 hypothetical protein [Entomospira culicis]WDI36758.1 hypothetical protein PVA46_05390 [Entomospira culicis]WDI38387.1 hypothetical protein PVA47_05400 [Entomospira culicis]